MVDRNSVQEILDGYCRNMGSWYLGYYRERLGLTDRAVATAAHVNVGIINLIESGIQPTPQLWDQIATGLERLARIVQKRQKEKELSQVN